MPARKSYLSCLARLLPLPPPAGGASRPASPLWFARPSFELEVISGYHTGARTVLTPPSCIIGSSSECDVVLSSEDIAERHVRINLYGWKARVEALEGEIAREGKSTVSAGYGYRADLPFEFDLGESRIRISRNLPAERPLKPLLFGVLAFVLLTLGVMVVARAIGPDLDDRLPPRSRYGAAKANHGSDAVAELQTRIDKAGLSTLRVAVDDGRVEVSGQLPPAHMPDWKRIERWFDRQHSGKYILASLVEPSGPGNVPHVRLQAVWFGADPYIVTGRGERRYPGDALETGWTLKSITADHVIVSRDGQDVAIAL